MAKLKPLPPTPQQLADEHWEFIEKLVLEQLRFTMLLYKQAIIHGYKHGKENNG